MPELPAFSHSAADSPEKVKFQKQPPKSDSTARGCSWTSTFLANLLLNVNMVQKFVEKLLKKQIWCKNNRKCRWYLNGQGGVKRGENCSVTCVVELDSNFFGVFLGVFLDFFGECTAECEYVANFTNVLNIS